MLNKILSLHPLIEFIVRYINLKFNFSKKLNKNRFKKINKECFHFDDLLIQLDKYGVDRNGILVTHSSFDNIKNCNLSPNQIISKLIDYISPNGTLVMNATRKFKIDEEGYFIYDVLKSKVTSGVLPAFFLKYKGVEISKFPINSAIAFGRQAKEIIENNIDGYNLSSCGEKSSWKFCMDNNAWILGLGIDLTHSLTMIHVMEETNHNLWPIESWFEEKKFKIIENNVIKKINILDRKEIWGKLHFAERTLAKDLVKNDILKVFFLNGTRFELLNSNNLYKFLLFKKTNTYPYFYIKKKCFKSY